MIRIVVRNAGEDPTGCDPCCCHKVAIRPGDKVRLVLDYAPWASGYPGGRLTPGVTWHTQHIDNCPAGDIDGFGPPTNTNYVVTGTTINLATNEGPPGNSFSYELVPLSTTTPGTFTLAGPVLTFTPPFPAWSGYAYASYRMTDAQGRNIVRHVQFAVNAPTSAPEPWRLALTPYMFPGELTVDQPHHATLMSIYMPLSCRDCDLFRMSVRQPLEECDGTRFWREICIDFMCKDCP